MYAETPDNSHEICRDQRAKVCLTREYTGFENHYIHINKDKEKIIVLMSVAFDGTHSSFLDPTFHISKTKRLRRGRH